MNHQVQQPVAQAGGASAPAPASARWTLPQPVRATLFALASALGVALLLLVLRDQVSVANVALLFLLPVLVAATLGGVVPGVLAAVACTLVFDLFFIKPYGTLNVGSAQDVLTLVLYLGVGALVAELSAHARARADEAAKRAAMNALLYDLSSALLAGDLDTVLGTLVERLSQTFALRSCSVLLPDAQGTLRTRAHWGPALAGPEHEQRIAATAAWASAHGEIVDLTLGTSERAAAGGERSEPAEVDETLLFLPFHPEPAAAHARASGLLALARPGSAWLAGEEIRLLSSFATQAGLAVERARLAEESAAATVLRESDRAKSVLLSNISHDLRTPLTTIRAAAESLLQAEPAFDEPTRQEMLASIRDESDRLGTLVGNLLDLSRLEAGALRLDRHLYDLAEIVGNVLERMRPQLAHHHLQTELAAQVPPILADYMLCEQVVVNVLGNAAKFAPAGTTITVTLAHTAEHVVLSVTDQGPGIAPEARERVFERFYRAPDARRPGVPGTGLGLAICQAVVAAHGGRIWIDTACTTGTTVRIALPIPPAIADEAGDRSGGAP